ncbi:hypothetical protein ABT288_30990 [Streptomyces sp. NPDC001093]
MTARAKRISTSAAHVPSGFVPGVVGPHEGCRPTLIATTVPET